MFLLSFFCSSTCVRSTEVDSDVRIFDPAVSDDEPGVSRNAQRVPELVGRLPPALVEFLAGDTHFFPAEPDGLGAA